MTTSELITSIKQTNNGYIFAPTADQLAAAKRNPNVFILGVSEYTGSFTIYLKNR